MLVILDEEWHLDICSREISQPWSAVSAYKVIDQSYVEIELHLILRFGRIARHCRFHVVVIGCSRYILLMHSC